MNELPILIKIMYVVPLYVLMALCFYALVKIIISIIDKE